MIASVYPQFAPPITGLILIDCWEIDTPVATFKTSSDNFYQNLINRVKEFKIDHVVNAMTRADTMKVNASIEQEILNNTLSFTTASFDEFVDICTNNFDNQPTHWYIAGQSWQLCVHNNDIALPKLSTLLCINVYADQKSFFKVDGTTVAHEDFVDDYLAWQYLPWFGYKLLPQGNNNI